MNKLLLTFSAAFLLVLFSLSFSSAHGVFPFIKEGEIDGVHYATGGVGVEERDLLKETADSYNLKVVFALASGDYLSNIPVVIAEPGGKEILDTVSTGPWLLVDLPQGRYKVIAHYKDQKKVRMVEVDRGFQTLYCTFAAPSRSTCEATGAK
jgi:hypothetical protein